MLASVALTSLLTVAEASNWTQTSTHADVMAFLEAVDEASDLAHLTTFGTSVDGKALPLLIIADPPVTAPPSNDDDRLVLFAFGNIHAGEVCGKAALQMLARDWTVAPPSDLLGTSIVLIAPLYNADGNDRMSTENRPGQVGPSTGMGERPNSQGLDLNRDYVKLEAPETRAMVRLLNQWDPDVIIDTHTTNGSRHRYALTYESPLMPMTPDAHIDILRDELLPHVQQRLREARGVETFHYGNFDRRYRQWFTYAAQPRFGANYHGLRGHLSILSEAYAYVSYRERIEVTYHFVDEIFDFAATHAEQIRTIRAHTRESIVAAGLAPQPDDVVGIRHRIAAFSAPSTILGYEPVGGVPRIGRVIPPTHDDVPRDYEVVHLGRFEATRSVRRPLGYLLAEDATAAIDLLRAHGVEMHRITGDVETETYTITEIERAPTPFQGHRMVLVEASAHAGGRRVNDALFVPTAQPLGTLIVYLLEPESEDGLTAWNVFDNTLEVGAIYPAVRVIATDVVDDER